MQSTTWSTTCDHNGDSGLMPLVINQRVDAVDLHISGLTVSQVIESVSNVTKLDTTDEFVIRRSKLKHCQVRKIQTEQNLKARSKGIRGVFPNTW